MDNIYTVVCVLAASDGILALVMKYLIKRAGKKDETKKKIAEIKNAIDTQADFDRRFAEQVADIQRYNIEAAKEREIVKDTLRLLSYDMLSNRLLYFIQRGFATKVERDSVSLYIKNYKANHWNGDMNALLAKFNALPFEFEEEEKAK